MDGSASGGAATRRSPSGLRRSRACRSTAAATRRLPARGAHGDHSLQELPDSSRLAGAAIGRLEAQGVGRLTARSRGGQQSVFPQTETRPTLQQANQYAIELAKKWIDEQ